MNVPRSISGAADLVFDLDGTISDPLVGIHRCMNYALVGGGFAEVSRSAVARLVGPPLDEAFLELVPTLEACQIVQLVTRYRERYAQTGYAENTLYDGVAEALADLSGRGLRLGVCTSKREDFADRILKMFAIRDLFEFVNGGDIGIRKKQQLGALKALGQVSGASTMIGDRAVDILAARANGLSSVGVLWGYGSSHELLEAGAECIIERASELSYVGRVSLSRRCGAGSARDNG